MDSGSGINIIFWCQKTQGKSWKHREFCLDWSVATLKAPNDLNFVTARVRITTEGNVFKLTIGRGGGYPRLSSRGTPYRARTWDRTSNRTLDRTGVIPPPPPPQGKYMEPTTGNGPGEIPRICQCSHFSLSCWYFIYFKRLNKLFYRNPSDFICQS